MTTYRPEDRVENPDLIHKSAVETAWKQLGKETDPETISKDWSDMESRALGLADQIADGLMDSHPEMDGMQRITMAQMQAREYVMEEINAEISELNERMEAQGMVWDEDTQEWVEETALNPLWARELATNRIFQVISNWDNELGHGWWPEEVEAEERSMEDAKMMYGYAREEIEAAIAEGERKHYPESREYAMKMLREFHKELGRVTYPEEM